MIIPDALPMSDVQAAWVAGLLDGEGCLDFTRNSPRVRIKMSDPDIVIRFATLVPGARLHGEAPRQPHHKPCYVAQVHGDNAVALMRAALPYLGTRRTAKATEIILAHSNRQARRANRHLRSAA